jgi:hypothetical protein
VSRATRLPRASAWLGLGVALYAASASAQGESALLGEWLLTLEERNAVHTGTLTFERDGGALAAYVDGGPAEIELAGGTIELNFDTRDGGGQLLQYSLRGRIAGDRLEGELTPPLEAPQGRWHAQRHVEPAPAAPQPVDFTGVWSRTSSGLARVTLDYTPAAQSAVDAYHYLDDPALRCA